MSRFDGTGRFDQRYELDSVFGGTQNDLQQYTGQVIPWFIFDKESSAEDDVYDVGATTGGRRWRKPIMLPVLSVQRTQGAYDAAVEGFYVTDMVHVSVSVRQAERAGLLLRELEDRPDRHLRDRFVWNGTVFSPTHIQERGLVQQRFTVIGIDALEVNPDELVNDPDFRQWAQRPD